MLKVALPLALVGLLMMGGAGLYLVQSYIDKNPNHIDLTGKTEMDPGATALTMVFQDLTNQTVIKHALDLRPFVADAPEGWEVRKYETPDGERITGFERVKTPISRSTVNDMLQQFQRSRGVGKRAEVHTYQKGDRLMALQMRVLDELNTNSVRGNLMAQVANNLSMVSSIEGGREAPPPFATVDGVPFQQTDKALRVGFQGDYVPADYRTFEAVVGDRIEIIIITNAADADVAGLMGNIQMANLQGLLPEPSADYRADAGFETALATPLATEPPGPGPAHRAFAMLQSGVSEGSREAQILRKVVRGHVSTWEDVVNSWEIGGYYVTDNLLEVLGEEPIEYRVPREARALLQESTNSDRVFLSRLAGGSILTQADAQKNRYWRADLSPETHALIALLPEGEGFVPYAPPPQDSGEGGGFFGALLDKSEPEAPQKPTVRRGLGSSDAGLAGAGNCTMEFGVRRCVMSDG